MAEEVCFDLPEDIIVNILCRLPLKSILRFKCVSKRWRSILSDPKFAISQFNLATEHQTLSRRVLFGTSSGFNSLDFDAPSLSFGDASSVRKLTFPLQQSGQHVRLAASCNGLVFAVVRVDLHRDSRYYDYQTSYYIWNPSLGFLRKLPDPRFPLLYSYDEPNDARFGYGFGYVAATDDYKILLSSTCCECDGFMEYYKFEVKIFSSRADAWKTIELPEREYHLIGDQGIFVNEALHWAEELRHEEEGNRMIVFNLANEELRVLQLRFLDEDDAENGYSFYRLPRVVVLGGCLGVLRSTVYLDGEYIDTWVMREYDVGDSWKLCSSMIPSADGLCTFPEFFFVEDGVLVRMGFSVWHENIDLVKYEQTEAKRFHHGQLYNVLVCSGQYTQERTGDLYGERMVRYDESLLWLNDDHGAKDQKNQNLNEGMKASCKIKEE